MKLLITMKIVVNLLIGCLL
ncbi:TPA: hypothetical protein QCV86_005095 [Bacillus thuringiensis]|nr:hypothetical protein [Bacillus cereus]HDR6332077.1 hypothetical protein [Bacillus thuringiensis]HDR6338596.1 hypothetical protein [Bacillus thuringiensis]HDR6344834.1 hypothetical protein [Bacillus thuringiensis]HDR6351247.1 hypothetical protein [Bacillus thuringiensis]